MQYKTTLIDGISTRSLGLKIKLDTIIKSKALKYVVK